MEEEGGNEDIESENFLYLQVESNMPIRSISLECKMGKKENIELQRSPDEGTSNPSSRPSTPRAESLVPGTSAGTRAAGTPSNGPRAAGIPSNGPRPTRSPAPGTSETPGGTFIRSNSTPTGLLQKKSKDPSAPVEIEVEDSVADTITGDRNMEDVTNKQNKRPSRSSSTSKSKSVDRSKSSDESEKSDGAEGAVANTSPTCARVNDEAHNRTASVGEGRVNGTNGVHPPPNGEEVFSDQRNGSDDQQDLEQSRRISGQGMERPQQFKTPINQYRTVSTPQVNQTLVAQNARFINGSHELSSISVLSDHQKRSIEDEDYESGDEISRCRRESELSSLRNGSQVDHDSIPNVSGFCNPPIRDLSEEEEAVLPARRRRGRPIREKGVEQSDDEDEGDPTVTEASVRRSGRRRNGTAINAEDADTADAVCNAKTPVSLLEELSVSLGMTPKYDLVQKEGADHEPTFQCSVTVGEFEETGFGQSKKKAKHSAAKAFLYRQPSAQNAGIAPPGQPIIPENVEKRKKRKRESNEDYFLLKNSELQQQLAERQRTIDDLQKELATARERIIKLNTQKFECEESENKRISNLRSKMAEKVADMKELLQNPEQGNGNSAGGGSSR
jgi:hypothetical protein